jgi:hypothetical protein
MKFKVTFALSREIELTLDAPCYATATVLAEELLLESGMLEFDEYFEIIDVEKGGD